ncbi:cation:proton antiporter [Kineococcus arenarius]|uniref:cation:proton antiporter n=1 Tax=Kineococcus sp. SYSU DK007 TaxID=3383128 RepID=UPI003D7DE646
MRTRTGCCPEWWRAGTATTIADVDAVVLLGLLVLGIVVLTPLAGRIGVPQPVVLTVYGLLLALVPQVPSPRLPPEVILPLVLPPLLFATTQRGSLRELRQDAGSVLFLAVGLTALSALVVAVVAHAFGLPWAVAVVLGAVVAPPDPVAATAVARRLRLPPRLVTVLEGEGQFNDATALTLYSVALVAVTSGSVGAAEIGWHLFLEVVGGTAIGLVAGLLARWALARLHDAPVETTVTIALPFAAYLVADEVQASGVLAVLAAGLLLRARGAGATTSRGWLLGRAVWRYVDFAVTGLLFGFLGIELTTALEGTSQLGNAHAVALAVTVVAVLIALRFAVVHAASALAGRRARRRGSATPAGWREATVASWAGMRGVVTVALALALPVTGADGDFPYRAEVVLVALVTVLVTLIAQGLTLAPLVRHLHVAGPASGDADVRRLRREATAAALRAVEGPGNGAPEPARATAAARYRARLAHDESVVSLIDRGEEGPGLLDALDRLHVAALDAERETVLEARRTGAVSPDAADEVLFEVEARASRYE